MVSTCPFVLFEPCCWAVEVFFRKPHLYHNWVLFKAMGYCRSEWVQPGFSKLITIFKKTPQHQQQYWANKVELKAHSCAVIAPWSVDIKHLVYSMAVQIAHPRHRCETQRNPETDCWWGWRESTQVREQLAIYWQSVISTNDSFGTWLVITPYSFLLSLFFSFTYPPTHSLFSI